MFRKFIFGIMISLVSIAVYASSQLFLLCKSDSHGAKWKLISGPYNTIAECDRAADAHRASHLHGESKTIQCSWNKQEVIIKRLQEGSLIK